MTLLIRFFFFLYYGEERGDFDDDDYDDDDDDDQLKCCCSNQGQKPEWSSIPQNILDKLLLSSLAIWWLLLLLFSSCFGGSDLEEVWKSWAKAGGLKEVGKRGLLVGWCWCWWGLSMAGVLEMSNLMLSELFSLLLLQDPSVSLFRLIDSVGSLLFSAIICPPFHKFTNQLPSIHICICMLDIYMLSNLLIIYQITSFFFSLSLFFY